MRSLLSLFLLTLPLAGCPESNTPEDDQEADSSVFGICETVECGANGRCVEESLLPVCECDPGFTANGLTCVREPLTDAPDDFECEAVDGSGPHFNALVGGRFAQVANDRTCSASSLTILEFRDNGVFVFWEQRRDAVQGDGATVLYGCWSVDEVQADRVIIAYDYGIENGRNCGFIGGLEDPPCRSELAYKVDVDAIWRIAAEESFDERHLLFRVPEENCTVCSDQPTCCDKASWRSDRDGPLGCE